MGIFKSMFNVGWTLLTLLRLETHYAWVSRVKGNFSRLIHKSGQVVLYHIINNEI